jgi:hypothetical protein
MLQNIRRRTILSHAAFPSQQKERYSDDGAVD